MNRRDFITSTVGGVALSSGALSAAAAATLGSASPVATAAKTAPVERIPLSSIGCLDVGSQAQLFLDQQVVYSSERIVFTQHAARKHPLNPLVKADQPWEGWRINIYGTVLYDEQEKIFKMWYMGGGNAEFPHYATFYATSRDGVQWEKPRVGTVKTSTFARHNAVLEYCQIASVTKDLAEPDPSRRYKMIEWSHAGGGRVKPAGGPHALVSPDGLNWTRVSQDNIFRSNDVVTAYYDTRLKKHVAFPKLSTQVRGGVRRCFGVTATNDLLKWPDPRLVFQPDLRDDAGTLSRIGPVRDMLDVPDSPLLMRTEFYGVGVYQAESCVVGFPWIFSINNDARFPLDRTRNHEGPCEIQLASSRDLQTWERPFRTPVIPLGAPGAWDSGFLTTASQAFRHQDQILLYYGGGNYTHGNPTLYDEYQGTERGKKYTASIGLATWPLDRFVSADGGAEGGILITMPVHFSGRRLELNLAAPKGRVTVELLDAAGKPLSELGKSDPVNTDSIRTTVTWKGRDELSQFAGKPVCLRFELHQAELYSFAFRA